MSYNPVAFKAPITSSAHNDVLRQTRIRCTSITRPTDPDDDMLISESDTGYELVWKGGRWTYYAWAHQLDSTGPALLGTRPVDLLATPPIYFKQSVPLTVLNAAGGVEFDWPTPFSNCILHCGLTLHGSTTTAEAFIRTDLDNWTLTSWSGQAYGFAGIGDPTSGLTYMDLGQDLLLSYEAHGC